MISRFLYRFEHREGLIIRYGLKEPFIWSEAAPFPGFSHESLDDILNAPFHDIPETLPSLRFAIDGIRFQQTPAPPRFQEIAVNALIPSSDAALMESAAEAAILAGFRTLKIKVGLNIEAELDVLHRIATHHPHIKLRLDANARFTLPQLVDLLPALSSINPEYLEQPVASTDDLMRLARISTIPIAADESVRTPADANRLLSDGAVKVLILKPMLIGYWSDTIRILESAYHHNVACVITTSMESGIGRRLTAMFTSRHAPLTHAHGLSTGFLMTQDLLRDSHLIRDGFYHPEPIGDIDESHLIAV